MWRQSIKASPLIILIFANSLKHSLCLRAWHKQAAFQEWLYSQVNQCFSSCKVILTRIAI